MPWAYKNGVGVTPEEIKSAIGSFFYDLTAATSAAQLSAMQQLVPPDHLFMGFDFPMQPAHMIARTNKLFEEFQGFDTDQRQKIISGNAINLFPRLA